MPASGLFDYFSELDNQAWLDMEVLPVVWFDKDIIATADSGLRVEEVVVLQAVNRAGTF